MARKFNREFMYIEQGYRSKEGLWKFFVLPVGFIALLIFNYILTINSPIDTTVAMGQMIDQFGSNVVFTVLLIPLVFGFLLVLGWTFLVMGQSITALTTSRKKIDFKRIFFAFVLWSLVTIAFTGLDIFLNPQDFVWNFDVVKFIPLAIIAILLVPLQTSFEEYLFRGQLMQGLGLLARNRWLPLVLTSVLFGLMHLGNPEVGKLGYGILIYYIGTGLFLGTITLMDEGLELALGFHAANNLITALLVTADWTAFHTHSLYKDISEPALGWDVLIPVLVVYPILIAIFSKKYGWRNWKGRLFGRVLDREEFLAVQDGTTELA